MLVSHSMGCVHIYSNLPAFDWGYVLYTTPLLDVELIISFVVDSLKDITVQLLDYYTSEKSPIKTIGQLRNEPVQTFTVPVQYKTVKEHLQL